VTKKKPPNRARPVHKAITFSKDEWARVERRQALSGAKDFGTFARQTLLDGEVRVRRVAFDPAPLRIELSRIGNNINQIARQVNTDEVVTYEEMRAARLLIQQVQAAITEAISRIEDEA
jgi:hypothetical protein